MKKFIRIFFLTLFAATSISLITALAYTTILVRQAQQFSKKMSKNPGDNKSSKKIFMLTGEVSGDKLGAWYLQKIKDQGVAVECQALGQKFLKAQNAQILEGFDELYVGNGLLSLALTLPGQLKHFNRLVDYVLANNFDEVVLVDFPLINIPFARALKKRNANMNITFIAPPELWFWGSWNIDEFLKAYCDNIIVLYPHEVAWYQSIGMQTTWLGYPYINEFEPYLREPREKRPTIALLPGSRLGELKTMMPIFVKFIQEFSQQFPQTHYLFPIASSFQPSAVQKYLDKAGIPTSIISIVQNEEAKKDALSTCCLAISKPGTITLELALLGVPTIVTYKVSWLSHKILKTFVNPTYISLPNLLTGKDVCIELLQDECNATALGKQAALLYTSFLDNSSLYQRKLYELDEFRKLFVSQANHVAPAISQEKAPVPQAVF
ncbi:hypothetical protein K2W90_01065 [Candidatus Babeliales bacterium]|nr:hypothetical protein [Candidatus Babeliales bacterium]